MPSTSGSDVHDLLQKLDRAIQPGTILDLVENFLLYYKFQAFSIARIPLPGEHLSDVALGIRWPGELLNIYSERRYEQDDPIFLRCRHSLFPFVWTQDSIRAETGPRGREMLRFASKYGLKKGFAVPIHGPKGYMACVRMSGPDPELDSRVQTFLHLVALHVFKRLLCVRNSNELHTPLTQREQEVLKLVAQGKSAREIGTILSITKRTADEHASNSVRKLGAANRTHAVAIAIRDKVIIL